jgi:hypothetical protein
LRTFWEGLLGFVLEGVTEEDGAVCEGGEVGGGVETRAHDAEVVDQARREFFLGEFRHVAGGGKRGNYGGGRWLSVCYSPEEGRRGEGGREELLGAFEGLGHFKVGGRHG